MITQYHALCYVPFLVENKDKIKQSIINYWKDTVHPLLKENNIESYVLDVAWLKKMDDRVEDDNDDEKKDVEENDLDDYNWTVIELNPMCTNAGACLFEWTKEYQLFLNGDTTDFRVREEMSKMTPKELEDGLEAFKDTVQFLKTQK